VRVFVCEKGGERKPMSKFKLSQNKSKQLEDTALMRGLEVLGQRMSNRQI
jgi:hypothetical protein